MPRVPGPLQILWPLLATASATVLTDESFGANRLKSPFWFGCVLVVVAWLTVAVSWRRFYPRYSQRSRSFLAVFVLGLIAEIVIVRVVYRTLCPSSAEQQYKALYTAIQTGNAVTVKTLLAHGAEPNFVPGGYDSTYEERKLLVIAVKKGNVEIAQALIEQGADVSEKYQNLASVASGNDDFAMMRMLVEHHAPINTEFGGCRPLWDAVMLDRNRDVVFLIAHGANLNYKDTNGTILDFAEKKQNSAIIELLKQAGAKE